MRPPFTFIRVALLAILSYAIHSSALAGNGQWTLIGWNNLGMHCMDDDYSVVTILPPYNTVNSQLINAQGKLVLAPTGLTLTYEPIADLDGSIIAPPPAKRTSGIICPQRMARRCRRMPGWPEMRCRETRTRLNR
jgi:hypothetical protein